MSSAVAVLTAMITPAVLISACGSMILSTSSRLGRVVDRVRALADKLEELAEKRADETKERLGVIFAQLDKTDQPRAHSATCDGGLLSCYRHVCRHQRGDRGGSGHTKQSALQLRAGDSWARRSVFSFLRQHAVDFRSAAGAQHHPRGDGFYLEPNHESCARGCGGTAQTAFCTLSQSQVRAEVRC